jgi:hypothetical protein
MLRVLGDEEIPDLHPAIRQEGLRQRRRIVGGIDPDHAQPCSTLLGRFG